MTGVDPHPRWNGAVAAAALLAVLGVAAANRALVVAAVLPVAYVAYGALASVPDLDGVRVERSVGERAPAPGESVEVSLRVVNEGPDTLTDLRIVDGVPRDLAVTGGRARVARSLIPGSVTRTSYEVTAVRGDHGFGPVRLRATNLAGTRSRTVEVEPEGPSAVRCRVGVPDLSTDDRTLQPSGSVTAGTPGEGVEFHSTREYRPGDSLSRVDWRRYARTGELSTVEFNEQRASEYVVVVDAREACGVAAGPGQPTGTTLAAYAGSRAIVALAGAGHRVGLVALGVTDPATGEPPATLPPASDEAFRYRATDILEAAARGSDPSAGAPDRANAGRGGESGRDGAGAATPDGGAADRDVTGDPGGDAGPGDTGAAGEPAGHVAALRDRVPAGARVVLCSPCVDETPGAAVDALSAAGHGVTLVSPDVTAGGESSPGHTLAAAERELSLATARATGSRVVDWHPDEPVAVALAAALEGRR